LFIFLKFKQIYYKSLNKKYLNKKNPDKLNYLDYYSLNKRFIF